MIADQRQFEKLLYLMEQWYQVKEPVDLPYLRQYKNKYENGLPSPLPQLSQ